MTYEPYQGEDSDDLVRGDERVDDPDIPPLPEDNSPEETRQQNGELDHQKLTEVPRPSADGDADADADEREVGHEAHDTR